MNKRTFKNQNKGTITLLAAAAALIVCSAALNLKQESALATQGNPEQGYISYYSPKPVPSQEMAETIPSSSAAEAASGVKLQEEEYLITIYNGKIAVFREGRSSPFLTADTDVYLLPKADIDILRKGIRVTGLTAVKSVLEDYE